MRVTTTRAVFDLAHLDELSSVPGRALLVSERTLYLLLNLVASDITDRIRYTPEIFAGGYYSPVVDGDDEWPLFKSVAERAQIEVMQMTDVTEWMEQLERRVAPVGAGQDGDGGTAETDDPWYLAIGPVPDGQMWNVTEIATEWNETGSWERMRHIHFLAGPEHEMVLTEWFFDGDRESLVYNTRANLYLASGDLILTRFDGTSPQLGAVSVATFAIILEPL